MGTRQTPADLELVGHRRAGMAAEPEPAEAEESGVGPPLDRLGGAERRFTDGTAQIVDEAYLVESLLEPSRKIVAGYEDVMPSYAERIDEAEAEMLAAYLASLR